MSTTLRSFTFFLALLVVSGVQAEGLPQPEHIQIAEGMDANEANGLLKTAQHYYAFWNTGDESHAKKALSTEFIDQNLPANRPQGPTGPLLASAGFRKAVPDLSVTVKSVFVLSGKVISQLQFDGHFTGTFGELEGRGQPISFSAVDMYTIKEGRITKNWHLEDNLTLMKQLGAIE